MIKKTSFSNYRFDKKFHDLPIMFYSDKFKTLDLSRSDINIIPAGLKGVDVILLRGKPVAVAPDFKGQIKYGWGVCNFLLLTNTEIKKAKIIYKKYERFCETPHTGIENSPHSDYYNLPKNMHFVTVGNRSFLDLRKCNVQLRNRSDMNIIGIKAILLPSDRKNKAPRLLKRIKDKEYQRA